MSHASKPQSENQPSPFLGSLPAEGETHEVTLPPRFAQLAAAVGDLFDDYRNGEISATVFAREAAVRRITDTHGVEWTIGTTSGQWFRRDPSKPWLAASPPLQDAGGEDVDPLARLLDTIDITDDPELTNLEAASVVEHSDEAPPLVPTIPDTGGIDTADAAADATDAESDDSPFDVWGEPPKPNFTKPAPRGSHDEVWGEVTSYDPNLPAPEGIDTDGIEGHSVWFDKSIDEVIDETIDEAIDGQPVDDPDPL